MVELTVTGMTCGGCVNSVKRALAREFPDTDVQVNLETGLVHLDGDVDRARAELSIENAGFGVVSAST
jgi:copper chaperone CopZ